MRVLGTVAFILTVAAAVLNVVWFLRRGVGLGEFLAITWPAAAVAFGIVAAVMAYGVFTARRRRLEATSRDEQESPPRQ